MAQTSCPHHESVAFRIQRLESRMDRIEIGIFSAAIALLITVGTLLVQVWQLPERIRQDAATAYQEQGK